MTISFKDKVVIVTGAGGGLGRSHSLEFAKRGAKVVVNDLGGSVDGSGGSSDAANNVVKEITEAGGVAIPNGSSVTDDDGVKNMVDQTMDEFGRIDILINNAAIINRSRFLWEVPVEEFDTVIDTNIKGVTNVIRHFVPLMARRGEGVIVNFSSGWGRSASPEVAPYCASKWAIEGLSQSLAQELPSGLAVVPLNPGVINTDMLRSCFGPSAADFQNPDEWAKPAVPFLLSLGPSQNGQSLTVG